MLMRSMQDIAESLGVKLTTDQRWAGAYLERLGQRFCCEFGYTNAVDKAREHWNQRRRDRNLQRKAKSF